MKSIAIDSSSGPNKVLLRTLRSVCASKYIHEIGLFKVAHNYVPKTFVLGAQS